MTSLLERRQNWPSLLPDLFGWVEAGIPGLHGIPDLHSIRVEESLTDGTYTLCAELPGIDPAKDLELTITEGVLTLRAERETQSTDKRRTEFRYGTFARAIQLPAGARDDDATADYKDGVLTITVPVPGPKESARTIPVRRA